MHMESEDMPSERSLPSEKIRSFIHLYDEIFDEKVLFSETPILVNFWSTWCKLCKAMLPTLEEIKKKYDGCLAIGSAEVENNDKITDKYEINTVPYFLLFKEGEIVGRLAGSSNSKLFKMIKTGLGEGASFH